MFFDEEAGVWGERRWSVDGVDGPIPGRGGVMIVGMAGRECEDDMPVLGNGLLGVELEPMVEVEVDRGVFIVRSGRQG